MPRPKKDPEIKRKEFMEIAKAMFFSTGYDGVSIQDILTEAGNGKALSPSVFYYYFKSKEELFEAVVQDYLAAYLQSIASVFEDAAASIAVKMNNIQAIYRSAIDDFKKIDVYFDPENPRGVYFNYLFDMNCIRVLAKPFRKLLDEEIGKGTVPATPFLRQAGTKIASEIFLQALLPLTHQGRESDGQHHSEKYIGLLPLVFCQLFGLPSDIINQ